MDWESYHRSAVLTFLNVFYQPILELENQEEHGRSEVRKKLKTNEITSV
jgi:hypothetical protein